MSEQAQQAPGGAERNFCLSEICCMTRIKLLEIAQAQPHLWPSNAGSLGSKTLVKTLEGVLLGKGSGYTTTAPMPVDTTVVKKRRGGRGLSSAKPGPNPSAMMMPSATSAGSINSSHGTDNTAKPYGSGIQTSTQGLITPCQNVSNTFLQLFTVRLLDKRETPPAQIALDIHIDPIYISQDGCPLGTCKVKTNKVVRLLDGNSDTIKGFIKLSTPHYRITTDYQPFLFSKPATSLADTPVSVEYLLANNWIINIMVENASRGFSMTVIHSLTHERKHEEEEEGINYDEEGSVPDPSTSGLDMDAIPLHIARKRANLNKVHPDSKKQCSDDKATALEWITDQVVARNGYNLFSQLRGSDKAQNPEIVQLWLFVADLCTEFLSKSVRAPNASAKVKITKKMLWQSLGIHETTLNTMIHAANLVRKYGKDGPQPLPEVVACLDKFVLIDRMARQMPEGRKSLLEFLYKIDATQRSQ
ncbi:hypothetical protein BDP27DRAFT_1364948 [Rhodocollybia butyracea]|uniref:Uncharacterized protein n=1 Tax=Rhodocollybia butyracea TaxID=206335 RepID=A0A9P5PKD4_9AGAR|nr:hypothetical protein BDP27DRAFT_1364948 [Rhodocollybia butyracea]